MAKAAGRITFLGDPQSFTIADSMFELEIKNFKEFQGGKEMVSDKIQLMDLSDATWAFGRKSEYFYAVFHDFPDDLKSKSQAELFVSYDDVDVSTFHSGSLSDSKIFHTFYMCDLENLHMTDLEKHRVNNSITLNCRLVVTCEGDPNLRRKFYDPLAARKSVLDSVSDMYGDPTFSDFTFVVGGRNFPVHMNILAAVSPVMRKMFTADLKEAKAKECTIDAISPEIFGHLLRFIYRQEIPEDINAVAKPLYEAAHYYEIEVLKEICLQEIHESLSPDNALEVFEWVQPYDFEELKIDAWKIVKRDILKIFVKLEKEPLPLENMRAIIKHREQDKAFWKKCKEDISVIAEETS